MTRVQGMPIKLVNRQSANRHTTAKEPLKQTKKQQTTLVNYEIYVLLDLSTDYGHPDRAFFQKFETFGLGQTNWAEIL